MSLLGLFSEYERKCHVEFSAGVVSVCAASENGSVCWEKFVTILSVSRIILAQSNPRNRKSGPSPILPWVSPESDLSLCKRYLMVWD